MKFDEWNDFNSGDWQREINVRDFIQKNYTPYEGDSSFLAAATERTKKLWNEVLDLYKIERDNDNPENKRENLIFHLGKIYIIMKLAL